MTNRSLPLLIASASLVVFGPSRAQAQNSERFGIYEVHYNALVTSMLGAEMARQHGITRSDRGGMLNIAVHRTSADGSSVAVPATIRVEAVNLTGQRPPVSVREIAGDDVSYIGLFEAKGPDTYTFTLTIRPEGTAQALTLRFSQNFVGG